MCLPMFFGKLFKHILSEHAEYKMLKAIAVQFSKKLVGTAHKWKTK